jgi:hypothetical protein
VRPGVDRLGVGVSPCRPRPLTPAGYGEQVSDETTEPAPEPSEPTLAYPQPRPIPYGSSPYAVTVTTTNPVPDVRQQPLLELADLWTVILGTICVIPLGVVAGFVWLWLAPRAMAVADGKGKTGLLDPGTKAFAGADVTFLLIGVAAGVLCAVAAATLARHRGLAVSVAMAVGGTAASVLAAWIGRTLSAGPANHWQNHVSAGNHRYFIELGNRQFLLGWPIAALVITFIVGLLTPDRPVAIEPTEPAPSQTEPSQPETGAPDS